MIKWQTESADEAHHREIARQIGITFERLMALRRNFAESTYEYDPKKGL